MADTPKYERNIMINDDIIDNGMARFGFWTSSPVVAMQSNPTKPKKQVAAPFKVPENPNGKNPPSPPLSVGLSVSLGMYQFSMSAKNNQKKYDK